MRRFERLLVVSTALLLVGVPSGGAHGIPQDYFLTVKLFSDHDSRPLARANVKLSGRGVRFVDYPEDGRVADLYDRGLRTDATGSIRVILTPGDYRLTVTHEAHRTIIQDFTIPLPGSESQTQLEWRARMRMHERVLARALVVRVRGRDATTGRVRAVQGASVEVYDQDGWLIQGSYTDRDGRMLLESGDLILGESVRVKATSPGFAPKEEMLVVGSQQETANDPSLSTQTSRWDVVRITLEQGPTEEASSVPLIVEVNDRDSNATITSASVQVETRDGTPLGSGTTGADGRTEVMEVGAASSHDATDVRVRVSASGYEEAWSDLPAEYLEPSLTSRSYLVFLDRAAAPDNPWELTACEAELWDRFKRFARDKDPEIEFADYQPLRSSGTVNWVLRPESDDEHNLDASVSIGFSPEVDGRNGQRTHFHMNSDYEPTTLAGGSALVRVTEYGTRFKWLAGRYTVQAGLGSDWRNVATESLSRSFASQVASQIGRCPGGYVPAEVRR